MTEHGDPQASDRKDHAEFRAYDGKAAFEPGTSSRDGTFVFTKNPSGDDLLNVYELLVTQLGANVAPFEVVKAVYGHNPISFWGIYRAADSSRRFAKLAGLYAFLPLNAAGKDALDNKQLSGVNPDLAHIAPKGEDPVAFYLWAMVTPGMSNLSSMLVAHGVGPDLFENSPIIGWVSTESAREAVSRSTKTSEYADATIGSTFEIKFPDQYRDAVRALPIIEGVRPRARRAPLRPQLETVLVSTPDQMARVMAIRAAVFMVEQNCPYDEEFDGNDYAGAQMLGTVNGEPAAVLRIRYFANFVKLERLAVLPRFRRTLIAKSVIEHAIEVCRRKGYRKMYGQAQTRLVPLWARFGFRPMAKNSKLVFSDHEYVEIVGDLEPHSDPLTPDSDPLMLIRPEGQWDKPGVLDLSAARPPTNPH